MSIPWLIVSALLVGFVTYRIFYTLVTSVRLFGACVFMAAFIVIVQSREIIGHPWTSFGTMHFPFFSDQRTRDVPNLSEPSNLLADFAFQTISREDRIFLDEFLRQLDRDSQPQSNPSSVLDRNIGKSGIIGAADESTLRAEWAVNTAPGKHTESTTHKEVLKRAQAVTQNETSKRGELVRSTHR